MVVVFGLLRCVALGTIRLDHCRSGGFGRCRNFLCVQINFVVVDVSLLTKLRGGCFDLGDCLVSPELFVGFGIDVGNLGGPRWACVLSDDAKDASVGIANCGNAGREPQLLGGFVEQRVGTEHFDFGGKHLR